MVMIGGRSRVVISWVVHEWRQLSVLHLRFVYGRSVSRYAPRARPSALFRLYPSSAGLTTTPITDLHNPLNSLTYARNAGFALIGLPPPAASLRRCRSWCCLWLQLQPLRRVDRTSRRRKTCDPATVTLGDLLKPAPSMSRMILWSTSLSTPFSTMRTLKIRGSTVRMTISSAPSTSRLKKSTPHGKPARESRVGSGAHGVSTVSLWRLRSIFQAAKRWAAASPTRSGHKAISPPRTVIGMVPLKSQTDAQSLVARGRSLRSSL